MVARLPSRRSAQAVGERPSAGLPVVWGAQIPAGVVPKAPVPASPLVRRRGLAEALRLVLGLLVLGAVLVGCATLTEPWRAPEVAFVGLRVKEVTLDRQTFVVTLAVHNPNDRTLPIKAMTCRLRIQGSEVVEGEAALDRQIPGFGDALVDLEVAGSLLGLTQQLPVLALKPGPIQWTVSGTATLADGFLLLPYRYSGQVDAKTLLSAGAALGRGKG
jgi:LEA14-like dessication related protein